MKYRKNTILVKSIIDKDNVSRVLIVYPFKELKLTLSNQVACACGITLLQTATISVYEANFLKQLESQKDERSSREFFYKSRPVFSDYAYPGLQYGTNEPIVKYFIYDRGIELSIDECINHANNILRCVEENMTKKDFANLKKQYWRMDYFSRK